MVKVVNKNLYFYKVVVEGVTRLDSDSIYDQFCRKNLSSNYINIDGSNFLFCTHSKQEEIIGGHLIKIKETAPVIVEKKSFWDFIKFKKDQDPGEPSNLIWDLDNNVIISEMNWSGARHISNNFGKYLSKLLGREITISPLLQEEAYKILFIKKNTLRKVSIKVPKPHVNLLKECIGADINDMKKYIQDEEDLDIEISLSCKKHKKGIRLFSQPIIDIYNIFKGKNLGEDTKIFVQDNHQITLSLLDGALFKETMQFNIDGETKSINTLDFFNKVRAFWINKKEDILKLLQ